MRNQIRELENYLNTANLASTRMLLQSEARKLEDIARKVWERDMSSYTPKMYIRTQDAMKALKVGDVFRYDENHYAIEITFENDLSYHDSWFDKINGTKGRWERGHAVMLISDGWHAKKLESRMGRRVERFTYFEGTGYLYRVYKEYMKVANPTVSLEIEWSGKYSRR